MAMNAIQKEIRFHNLARAFKAIALHPDTSLDLAVEIDDTTITVMENNLHSIARKLNGAPLGTEIETWLNPVGAAIAEPVDAPKTVRAKLTGFDWKKTLQGSARTYTAVFKGLRVRIEREKPAKYDGYINDDYIASSKFKKSIRERLEKEAAKRANV